VSDDLYSDRCIEAAMRQRRYAHSLRRSARRFLATYEPPVCFRHVWLDDANTALRDAIRWIQVARVERIKENLTAEMRAIRSETNEYRTAAE
jgi:hypothetical protein